MVPLGPAVTFNRYWVAQFQRWTVFVMILKKTFVCGPAPGALPVLVQPVHTYWVDPKKTGLPVTLAVIGAFHGRKVVPTGGAVTGRKL